MINFDGYTNENRVNHNPNYPYIPDHLYRTLIIGGSGSGNTTLIISNEDMEDLIKIVKPLEDSWLLLEEVTESVQNELKEQKGGFLGMLLGTLGARMSGNLLAWKGIHRAEEELVKGINWIFNTASSFN